MEDLAALEAAASPGTRTQLLARCAITRPALEAVLAPLDAATLTRHGHEGWSVNDHLLHVVAWERMVLAHLRDNSDHNEAGLDRAAYMAMDNQQLNDHLHARFAATPEGEVRGIFEASRRAMLAAIAELDESRFAEPYWDDDPSGRTVMEKLTGDTYRHDLEHRRYIIELLDRL